MVPKRVHALNTCVDGFNDIVGPISHVLVVEGLVRIECQFEARKAWPCSPWIAQAAVTWEQSRTCSDSIYSEPRVHNNIVDDTPAQSSSFRVSTSPGSSPTK
eukprot:5106179-Amphidinium_carterae.2